MNLKMKIPMKSAVLCLIVAFMVACTSREQKNDAAFDRVKQEKTETNDSAVVNDAMTFEIAKKKPAVKIITDERTEFYQGIAKRIQANQIGIAELKNNHSQDGDMKKKATKMEEENNDLSIQLDKYNKDEKLKWELFKASMNQQVDEIGIELKAIKINAE